jgi:hypothetical protein
MLIIACSNNDSIGDDEFTFIVTDRGELPLTQRHQINTSYFEHELFTGNMVWFHVFDLATLRAFTSAKPWLNQKITMTIVCQLSKVRVTDGKEMKWFVAKEIIG